MRKIFSILLAIALPQQTIAAPLFDCPDLHNQQKLTIGEMTQGTDGWFFRIAGDLKQDFFLSQETAHYLRRVAHVLKQRGTTLVLLLIPPRGLVARSHLDPSQPGQADYDASDAKASYHDFIANLQALGMIVPDLLDLAEQAPKDKPFFFYRDHHWTPYGAKCTAEAVAALLTQQPGYHPSPSHYLTKHIGMQEMKHTMALELQRLCRTSIPSEPFPVYETQMVAGTTGAEALFGNADEAPLALIGTSFSATQNFNFAGFLSQATGREIANYALQAGGMFNAFISLVSSPQFAELQAPFLIWEMPGMYDLNTGTEPYFRQLIPALHGPCTEEEALATSEVEIQGNHPLQLMNIPAKKHVSGNGYYLFLESSNRGLAKFMVQLDYDNEDGEWFLVDRSQHFNNAGWFFIEINDEIEGSLVQVTLDERPDLTTTLHARLCKYKRK